jgi:hypothetical protein
MLLTYRLEDEIKNGEIKAMPETLKVWALSNGYDEEGRKITDLG